MAMQASFAKSDILTILEYLYHIKYLGIKLMPTPLNQSLNNECFRSPEKQKISLGLIT